VLREPLKYGSDCVPSRDLSSFQSLRHFGKLFRNRLHFEMENLFVGRRADERDAPVIAKLHADSWRSAYRAIMTDAFSGLAPGRLISLGLD
jgi:hypothetical protein